MSTTAYDMSAPDRDFAIQSLSRSLGENKARQLWSETCRKFGFDDQSTLTMDRLEKVVNDIADRPGALGVIAKSISVRIITYQSIKA